MLGRRVLVLIAVLAFVTGVALAGHGKEKCSYGTQECLNYMAEKMQKSGFIGVELDVDEDTGAYAVKGVIPGSPAEDAGLQNGDVLFAMNGIRIADENQEALKAEKKDWRPGKEVTYTIRREGKDREVTLTLAPMPADVIAKWIGQHMLDHAEVEIAQK